MNEAAAELIKLEIEDIIGQLWAGLDGRLNQIEWKNRLKSINKCGFLHYDTDLVTNTEFLRPVGVEILRTDEEHLLVTLNDHLARVIDADDLETISKYSNSGFWTYNLVDQVVYLSPFLRKLLDLTANPTPSGLRDHMRNKILPEDWARLKKLLLKNLNESHSFTQSFHFEGEDGVKQLKFSCHATGNGLHTTRMFGLVYSEEAIATGPEDERELSKEFAAYTVEHSQDIIFWGLPDGSIVYANQAACDFLGYTQDEMQGMPSSVFSPDVTPELLEMVWKEMREKKILEAEYRIVTKRGEERTITARNTYLRFGNKEYFCAFCRDVTEERQRQRRFELFQLSIEESLDMIIWSQPGGRIAYVNNATVDRLGYSTDELYEMSVRELDPSLNEDSGTDILENIRETGKLRRNTQFTTKSGEIIEVDTSLNYICFNEEEYICGINRDVTEEILRQRRRILSEFTIDNSREMIIWVKPDGIVHFANHTFISRTAYEAEEIIGSGASNMFPHLEEDYREKAWELLRSGETLEGEFVLLLKSGSLLPVYAKTEYLSFEGEEFSCVYLRDLTKKKLRDTQLLLAQQALDHSADCKLWVDEEFKVNYANQTLLNFIGSTRKKVAGLPFNKVLPGIDRDKLEDEGRIEIDLRCREGHVRQFDFNITILDHSGQRFYMLTGRDVSEMAQRRQELEAANLEISQFKDRVELENITLREEVAYNYNVNNIVTVSKAYQEVLNQVGQVAEVDTTVLIMGETGTGKELLARSIHTLSDRGQGPLIKVNCAALPESLIESELFGHEKGAFTGASARKRGRFEMADKGTLFLDEIGELPLELQSKLLRVLQEDEFERLGGTETIKVDVRLVAATNRNLREMVRKGTFRSDLFYRLNVFPITNLPLRDRPEDIPVLVEYFVQKFAKQQNKNITQVESADMKTLQNYYFPGNIRELENLVERAVVLCQSEVLSIPLDVNQTRAMEDERPFLTFEEMQRQHIIDALKMTGGRITGANGAGILLDMNDRTLVSKMRKLDIRKAEYLI